MHCLFCDALNQTADKKLFEVKRKDQMNALKNLIELNDVNQQYKIIDIMLKGLFKVSFTEMRAGFLPLVYTGQF